MAIPIEEVQQASSPVPLSTWATRWSRAAARAATTSRNEPVILTELNEFGVVVWQAPAPQPTDRDAVEALGFVGQWIAEPPLTAIGRWVQRRQLKALFSADRSFGSCGEHSIGQIVSSGVGGAVGAAGGAYCVGGPVALVWGFVAGAVLGCLMNLALALSARKHVRGPITAADADLFETITGLAQIHTTCSAPGESQTRLLSHRLAWHLTDQLISDADYARLRYQARMLTHASRRTLSAFDRLQAASGISGGALRIGMLVDDAAAVVDALQARAGAYDDLASAIINDPGRRKA